MADVLNKIKQACDTLQNRYCRLLLLTGQSAGKNAFADHCAEYVGCKKINLEAMRKSVADSRDLKTLLEVALTDKINDREMFMKGIDYSYYYEEEDNADA